MTAVRRRLRLRFRLRTFLLGVAALAVLLALFARAEKLRERVRLEHRAALCRLTAARHARSAERARKTWRSARDALVHGEQEWYAWNQGQTTREDLEPLAQRLKWLQDMTITQARRAVYYEQLRAKYDRAARQPWAPIEPDPPLP